MRVPLLPYRSLPVAISFAVGVALAATPVPLKAANYLSSHWHFNFRDLSTGDYLETASPPVMSSTDASGALLNVYFRYAEGLTAAFHVHSVMSGFGYPVDGDYGVFNSPYVSISASGNDPATIFQESELVPVVEFPQFYSMKMEVDSHHVTGHVAPGDEVDFDILYKVLQADNPYSFGITERITTPGDFDVSFTNLPLTFNTNFVGYDFTYKLTIKRAAGGTETSHVEVPDPPTLFGSNGVSAPYLVSGDYNRDGIVDAADYTIWRDHLGQTQAGNGYTLPNEGTAQSTGVVDLVDFSYWKSHFGATSGGAGSFSDRVAPEPASLSLFAIAASALAARRRYATSSHLRRRSL